MDIRRLASLAVTALALSLGAAPARAESEPADDALSMAIRGLEGSHDEGLAAVHALTTAGEPGLTELSRHWDRLSLKAQRRAVRALGRLAHRHPQAIDLLVRAAKSADSQLRRDALSSLGRTGAAGREGLAALLADPEAGDAAARELARQFPDSAMPLLLSALEDDQGGSRPGLRDAIYRSARHGGSEAEQALAAWLRSSPDSAALAGAALALSPSPEHAAFVSSCITAGASQASDFDTGWRFVLSARTAHASPAIDAWLASVASEAPEWMLRDAAIDALALRGHQAEARAALEDPYPRVRARAVKALAGDPESRLQRAQLARRDLWPMVRAEAVRSLGEEEEALPVLIAAVDDPMSEVRSTAIDVLASKVSPHGWDRVGARLRDRREWPAVTASAIGFVAAHCQSDAVPALMDVVFRAAPSSAQQEDYSNAARAILALRKLDTDEARTHLRRLEASPGLPPTLQTALLEALPEATPCQRPPQ